MKSFGTHEGEEVFEVEIASKAGARAKIITWGAALRDLVLPRGEHVVLGFDDLATYVKSSPHAGATPGRFANRIANGRFTLDGVTHQLDLNQDGKHHRHGGKRGFGKRVWRVVSASDNAVTLGITAEDGEMGYPGRLEATCTYELLEPSTLAVSFTATTDKATVVNLTNHSYFNLDASASIAEHVVQIHGDEVLELDGDAIPTGVIKKVAGTAYDLKSPRTIGSAFAYDISFVIPGTGLRHAATVSTATTTMETWCTAPALQFYDGHKLDLAAKGVKGLAGAAYGPRAGVCFEPQHFPDAPNHPDWPSTVLRPGETYNQRIEYRFGVR